MQLQKGASEILIFNVIVQSNYLSCSRICSVVFCGFFQRSQYLLRISLLIILVAGGTLSSLYNKASEIMLIDFCSFLFCFLLPSLLVTKPMNVATVHCNYEFLKCGIVQTIQQTFVWMSILILAYSATGDSDFLRLLDSSLQV